MTEKIFLVKNVEFDIDFKNKQIIRMLKNFKSVELSKEVEVKVLNKAWVKVDWKQNKSECGEQLAKLIFEELKKMEGL